jgi:hypothetical protein
VTIVIHHGPDNDSLRRERLFAGHLYVIGPTPSVATLAEHARSMIQEAFDGDDPETAQYRMPVHEYAELLGKLKPKFIHHPESKRLIQDILREAGCDVERTYFEVPKLRSSTSDNYLTAGIAYAWHPHRDTWYSAPQCQINWWLPVYPIEAGNCMTLYPQYFAEAVPNTSAGYNYYEWNEKYRGTHVTRYIKDDPRPLPKPTGKLDLSNEMRIVCPVGSMILFSGAHLHASVPNLSGKTRWSADFRTVNLGDLHEGSGAPNVDAACTGTVLAEFKRASDLKDLPDEVIASFADGTEARGRRVYDPRAHR